MDSTRACEKLHKVLEKYPEYRHPIDWRQLPSNGVYFFYQKGETWGHGGIRPRIVRVGTHRKGNFVSRMKSHYIDVRKIERMSSSTACPKDRSIFRKNIGRALLGRTKSKYLSIWNIDFQTQANRKQFGGRRKVDFERRIEREITDALEKTFSFRVIPTGTHEAIIGGEGLEARLIGTLANCGLCQASRNWLGKYSPVGEIRNGKLWLVQHLSSGALKESDWLLCRGGHGPGAK
jgi:hypothetical protein